MGLRPFNSIRCSNCQCVHPVPYQQCMAINTLVRPEEVRHLFGQWPPEYLPFLQPGGDVVATWLRQQLDDYRLRYIPDPNNCDLWCRPATTLLRGGGDCDDLAILASSLLHRMRVPNDVVVGASCRIFDCNGHAWVEGHDSQGWFLIEATSGEIYRWFRPRGYFPALFLRPGQCRVAA